ncbi:hypothetical protein GCM10008967_25740 [Bacillus carboniphilus]|uniref:LysM domain-containing protein n=1 Tax=Bacillus carboniphilus TaxID=86663 RepID=A0ABN0WDW2_9BACI
MTHGNTSYLRFSLEESVWFRKGQEVAELLSISLEPNVTIQEQEQYVAIHGSLELTGEYRQVESDGNHEVDDLSSGRYVRISEQREDDCYVFQHYFPVDITIPRNRVNSLQELDVNVDSFDYVLPESSCLKLSADLTVTGVRGQEESELQAEEVFEDEVADSIEEEAAEEQYELVLHRSAEEEQEESSSEEQEESREEEAEESSEDESSESQEEASYSFAAEARKAPEVNDEEDEVVPINIAYQANRPNVTNEWNHEEALEPAYRSEGAQNYEDELYEEEVVEAEQETHDESSSSDYHEEVLEDSKKNVKVQSLKQKTAKGKGISLAEFFARKVETEETSKLKVCFVQHGDSVDSIAERYEVSVQQLLKVNHLEAHEDVHEGQVLYIPTAIKPMVHKK